MPHPALRSFALATALLFGIAVSSYSPMVENETEEKVDVSVHEPSELRQAFIDARVELTAAGKTFMERLQNNPNRISNSTLTGLTFAAVSKVLFLNKTMPNEKFFDELEPFNTESEIESVTVYKTKVLGDAEEAVTAWETELAAEVERIRIAEEKRKAEEAAAEAAARANKSNGGSNQSYVTPSGSSGSALERLNRIKASLPLSIPPIALGGCPGVGGSVVACYIPAYGSIQVTSYGLTKSDCKMREVLAHESRHYWQHINGQIQMNGAGSIVNRDQLEADAYAFGRGYGC